MEIRHPRPAVLAFLVLGLVHLPILMAYAISLTGREHYRFFPVVWIALAVFVWLRGDSLAKPPWYATTLLILDFGLVLTATALHSPWLGYAGFCSGCAAVLMMSRDRSTDGSLIALILLPLLTLRPPMNVDAQIVTRLQLLAAQSAGAILDRLDVLHCRMGVILQLPNRDLFVDEACSGIQSLFTLLCLAVLIVIIQRRHWLLSVLLLASAPVWALMLNIVRITAIVVADAWFAFDLSAGWAHEILGYCLVAISIVCLLSTDRLLLLCTLPIPIKEEIDSEPYDSNPFVRYFNRLIQSGGGPTEPAVLARFSRTRIATLAVVGGGLLAAQTFGFGLATQGDRVHPTPRWYAADSLSANYGSWTLERYTTEQRDLSSDWGERSCQWRYAAGSQSATVSLDYAFLGWHELTNCYANSGWQIIHCELRPYGGQDNWPCAVATMQNELGTHGLLCFSLFGQDGRPVPAAWNTAGAVSNRWKRGTGPAASYQAQAFQQSLLPLGGEDMERMIRLHFETRRDLCAAVTKGASP